MATSDVDQKVLGRLANLTSLSDPYLSKSLYQILGISVILSRKLFRARKLRKLDTSRDTKSLSLYHHIIWLAREGLSIVEMSVLPFTQEGQQGRECRVLSAKLRASFYHIFCLFSNNPPITQAAQTPSSAGAQATPVSPNTAGHAGKRSPGSSGGKAQRNRLRETIPSMTSEASYVTNPYANYPPGTHGTGDVAVGRATMTPPPSHPPPREPSEPPRHPPGLAPLAIPQPNNFLIPAINYLKPALLHFQTASHLAMQLLPGSHPLRLSVALEHCAFLWDCFHDHDGARKLARKAVADVYRAQEGMDDAEFEDAAELVSLLGAMMRRKANDSTPAVGSAREAAIGSPVRDSYPSGPGPTTKHAPSASSASRTQPQPSKSQTATRSQAHNRSTSSKSQAQPTQSTSTRSQVTNKQPPSSYAQQHARDPHVTEQQRTTQVLGSRNPYNQQVQPSSSSSKQPASPKSSRSRAGSGGDRAAVGSSGSSRRAKDLPTTPQAQLQHSPPSGGDTARQSQRSGGDSGSSGRRGSSENTPRASEQRRSSGSSSTPRATENRRR